MKSRFSAFLKWYGLPRAVALATTLHLQFQRPLQALLAMSGGCGKNCTKQIQRDRRFEIFQLLRVSVR